MINYFRFKQDPYLRNHQYLQDSLSKLSFDSSTIRNLSQERIISETRFHTEDSSLNIHETPKKTTSICQLNTFPEFPQSSNIPNYPISLSGSLIKTKERTYFDRLTLTSKQESKLIKHSLKKENSNNKKYKDKALMENILTRTPTTIRNNLIIESNDKLIQKTPRKLEYSRKKVNSNNPQQFKFETKNTNDIPIIKNNSKISSFEYSYGKGTNHKNKRNICHKVRIIKRSVSKDIRSVIKPKKIKRSRSKPSQNHGTFMLNQNRNNSFLERNHTRASSSLIKKRRNKNELPVINLNPYDYYGLQRNNHQYIKPTGLRNVSNPRSRDKNKMSNSLIRNKLKKIQYISKNDNPRITRLIQKEVGKSEYYS